NFTGTPSPARTEFDAGGTASDEPSANGQTTRYACSDVPGFPARSRVCTTKKCWPMLVVSRNGSPRQMSTPDPYGPSSHEKSVAIVAPSSYCGLSQHGERKSTRGGVLSTTVYFDAAVVRWPAASVAVTVNVNRPGRDVSMSAPSGTVPPHVTA